MDTTLRSSRAAFLFVAVAASGGLTLVASQKPVNQDAQTMSAFTARAHTYVLLHRKIEGAIKKPGDSATPQELDTYQRELGRAIIAARPNARAGDIFGPDMTALVKRLLAPVFSGSDGAHLKHAISDEEPHPVPPVVNARYPDDVPLSTMPPDVLKALPRLEEEIEYRFIGRHLILLDPHAHLVVDVVQNAMPA